MADDETPDDEGKSEPQVEGEGGVVVVAGAPAVVVDPRMRSRRISVRRGEGRRRLKWVALVVAVLALGVVAVAATRSPLLDVDQVTVAGTGHTPEQAVLQAAGIRHGDALVGVDLGAAAHRVEELPWVDRAKVSRDWPSTVHIQVTERTVAAIVQVGE